MNSSFVIIQIQMRNIIGTAVYLKQKSLQ